jgi:hypothetical protein
VRIERKNTVSDATSVTKSLDTIGEGGRDNAPSFIIPIVVGIGVLALVLAFVFWPRSTPQPVTPTAVPIQPTAVPTAVPAATPETSAIDTYVALIGSHVAKGDYQVAITTAEGALDTPDISDAERKVLIGYIVSAGMKDIESQEFRPLDRAQHQQLVDTYLSLVERASIAGITIDTPLEVAVRAHVSSQFPLAKVAAEEALKAGSYNPKIDRDITRLYVSTLCSLGEWYSKAPKGTPLYDEGVRALVTSDLIADQYKTGQSEAEVLLKQLGYNDKKTWPDPLSTPLLP